MKKYLLLMLCLSSFYSVACEITSGGLRAEYEIQSIDNHTGKVLKRTNLILWRDTNRVAHQYAQTQVTEGWELVSPKLIKASRYFDNQQRTIEYQPGEVVHGKKETDFSARNQLISDTLMANLTLESIGSSECDIQQNYSGSNRNKSIQLSWLKQQKLIQSMRIKGKHTNQLWQLKNVKHDSLLVQAFFNKRDHYQSTDFADIGDDHTDPFLTRMLNLGFIEHGASGFYQAQDNPISHPHQH